MSSMDHLLVSRNFCVEVAKAGDWMKKLNWVSGDRKMTATQRWGAILNVDMYLNFIGW